MKIWLINYAAGTYPPEELYREEIEIPDPEPTLEERVKALENKIGISVS